NLPIRQPARLERLQPVVAERHIGSAPGLAGHAPALLFAVLHFLRHQHRCIPRAGGSGGAGKPGGSNTCCVLPTCPTCPTCLTCPSSSRPRLRSPRRSLSVLFF